MSHDLPPKRVTGSWVRANPGYVRAGKAPRVVRCVRTPWANSLLLAGWKSRNPCGNTPGGESRICHYRNCGIRWDFVNRFFRDKPPLYGCQSITCWMSLSSVSNIVVEVLPGRSAFFNRRLLRFKWRKYHRILQNIRSKNAKFAVQRSRLTVFERPPVGQAAVEKPPSATLLRNFQALTQTAALRAWTSLAPCIRRLVESRDPLGFREPCRSFAKAPLPFAAGFSLLRGDFVFDAQAGGPGPAGEESKKVQARGWAHGYPPLLRRTPCLPRMPSPAWPRARATPCP